MVIKKAKNQTKDLTRVFSMIHKPYHISNLNEEVDKWLHTLAEKYGGYTIKNSSISITETGDEPIRFVKDLVVTVPLKED